METWVKLLTSGGALGVIAVVLVVFAGFFYTKIWPLIEKRLEKSDMRIEEVERARREEHDKFTTSLQELTAANRALTDANIQATKARTEDSTQITAALRQVAEANTRNSKEIVKTLNDALRQK